VHAVPRSSRPAPTIYDIASIIGYDDIFGSDFTSHRLSTIRTPLGLIGERTVRRALELVEDIPAEGVDRDPGSLPTELVIRGLSGPVARG